MDVTKSPRPRRRLRGFTGRPETLEARALMNASIDIDAGGRLTYRSDPALASALRVSEAGGVYTFNLSAAGPVVDVTSNAAGLAVTGSGTRTATVAGPSALQLVARADSDSILLAGAAVPVGVAMPARSVVVTVGDQADPRGLGAVTAPVSVAGSGASSGDSLILDDRGWRTPDSSIQWDLGYFTVTSNVVTTVNRTPFASVSYAGVSALTIQGAPTTGWGTSFSVVLGTAAGVDTRLDLGATANRQDVDVMSTSADPDSRLTIVGGQASLNARIDASSSPVAIVGGQGPAANTLTAGLWGMGPGTSVAFHDDDGPNALWIDSGGLPISFADFQADPSGALAFQAEAPQAGTIVATNVQQATVVGLAPSPPVVDSIPVVSTGATLTDATVGAFTSYPSVFDPLILWGDGSASDGVVVADPTVPNHYFIQGSHTYARAGTYLPGLTVHAFDVAKTMNIAGASVRFEFGDARGDSRNALAFSGRPMGVTLDASTYATGDPRDGASGLVNSPTAVVALYAAPRRGTPILLGRSTPDGARYWSVSSSNPLPDGLYTLAARAEDPATGLTSALTTLPDSLIVDTVSPRVVNVSIHPRRGRILVTYRDYGGYRNQGVGVAPETASVARYYGLNNDDGQGAWDVTSAVASPGWNPLFLRVAVQINDGAPLPRGSYRLYIAAYRAPQGPVFPFVPFPNFFAGVRDRTYNGLDGGFAGRFPTTGEGGFEGRFVVRHGRALPIRPILAAARAHASRARNR